MDGVVLEATFPGEGLVFGRFTRHHKGCVADLVCEPWFLRHGCVVFPMWFRVCPTDREAAHSLALALERQYGPPATMDFDAATSTWSGRVLMQDDQVASPVLQALFHLRDQVDTPWFRFKEGITTLRAQVRPEADVRGLERQVQALVKALGGRARFGPMDAQADAAWEALQAAKAYGAGLDRIPA